jgi:allantoicase
MTLSAFSTEGATFTGLIDLASVRLGGQALLASDEFFAEKENLLKPGRAIFIPDKYTENGKWMDGWESRRKRTPGHDWCLIRMGVSGVLKGVDIDTQHFLGNHPPYASLEACCVDGDPSVEALMSAETPWVEILERVALKSGSQNLFSITNNHRWTHVRLNIYPDGGVARLRLYGNVVPDWSTVSPEEAVDLAAVENGGMVVACSDMFFGAKENLIMPGRAANMGDGWETRRRRGPGYDWTVVQLGAPGLVQKIEVDTNHFKGNYPDRCSIDSCFAPNMVMDTLTVDLADWRPILPETKLQASHQHFFEKELRPGGPVTHIRLNIFPDGGISRFRVMGTLKQRQQNDEGVLHDTVNR